MEGWTPLHNTLDLLVRQTRHLNDVLETRAFVFEVFDQALDCRIRVNLVLVPDLFQVSALDADELRLLVVLLVQHFAFDDGSRRELLRQATEAAQLYRQQTISVRFPVVRRERLLEDALFGPERIRLNFDVHLAGLLILLAFLAVDRPPSVRLSQHVAKANLLHDSLVRTHRHQLPQEVIGGIHESPQIVVEQIYCQVLCRGVHQEIEISVVVPLRLQALLDDGRLVFPVAHRHLRVRVGRRLAEQVPILALETSGLNDTDSQERLGHRVLHGGDVDLVLPTPDPMDEDPIGQHEELRNAIRDDVFEGAGDLGHVDNLRDPGKLPADLRRGHHGDLKATDDGQRVHQWTQNNEDLALEVQLSDADIRACDVQGNVGIAVPIDTDAELNAWVAGPVLLPSGISYSVHVDGAQLGRIRPQRELAEADALEGPGDGSLQLLLHILLHQFLDGLHNKGPNLLHREVQPLYISGLRTSIFWV
mmetsp:Transcript_21501/g.61444  ORF Transcript_21501/g.61444 Transcript_21501/m.61444 type:complete len:477 (+) Transcript_21501:359-1789(+)